MTDAAVPGPPPSDPSKPDAPVSRASTDDERLAEVLGAEYSLLASALAAAWSASLTRTSLFLFSLSASGVALGFAAQGGIAQGPFRTFALVVLPVVLFIGVATFIRIVQVQRESIVYKCVARRGLDVRRGGGGPLRGLAAVPARVAGLDSSGVPDAP
jgi:hypothetical protein